MGEELSLKWPVGSYNVVLADPPWQYDMYDKVKKCDDPDAKWTYGAASYHYDTMSLDDIKELPVGTLVGENAALFLWVTDPHLPDGLGVIEAWGFEYKNVGFTWAKLNKDGSPFMGLGYYTRGNPEMCLFATRGSVDVQAHDVRQLIRSQRRKHSQKPDEQYERIERLLEGPYVELFARQRREGWVSWGYEEE